MATLDCARELSAPENAGKNQNANIYSFDLFAFRKLAAGGRVCGAWQHSLYASSLSLLQVLIDNSVGAAAAKPLISPA